MIRYVAVSHGRLAEGFADTLKLFVGEENRIDVICAYTDQEGLMDKWRKACSRYGKDDEIIVFTDLYGGSVNQFFTGLIPEDGRIHVITGCNLGLLAELVTGLKSPVTDEAIERAVSEARKGLLYMNSKIEMVSGEEIDE